LKTKTKAKKRSGKRPGLMARPAIPALGRQRQVNHESKASPGRRIMSSSERNNFLKIGLKIVEIINV
jgi:hypothetical protein